MKEGQEKKHDINVFGHHVDLGAIDNVVLRKVIESRVLEHPKFLHWADNNTAENTRASDKAREKRIAKAKKRGKYSEYGHNGGASGGWSVG